MHTYIEQLKKLIHEIENAIHQLNRLSISEKDKNQLNDWLFYSWLMVYDSFEQLRELEKENDSDKFRWN